MNKAKVEKNIKNLIKIKDIIGISKFDTLNKLQKATKITNSYVGMALQARDLILFAKKKYKIKSSKNKAKPTLWVYITPESEIMSTSNSHLEKIILEGFDFGKDKIIALGESAIEFTHKNNLVAELESLDTVNKEESISVIISSLISLSKIKGVKFILNSPKMRNEPIIIYPFNEVNINSKWEKIEINNKFKFYPSIVSSMRSLNHFYVFRMTFALIKESQYYYLKEKLMRHEASIKTVDNKIEEKTRNLNKLNRKQETEELILVSQIAKGAQNE